MRYALLVCDWTLPRCLSCTNRRVWPVTNDSSFDESERNGQGVVCHLQNGGVWRGRRNGARLDILTRSDALDSEYTAVSGRGPRKCASNRFTYSVSPTLPAPFSLLSAATSLLVRGVIELRHGAWYVKLGPYQTERRQFSAILANHPRCPKRA